MRRFLPLLVSLIFAAASLRAQNVHWQPAGGTLGLNQVGQLSLVFDQCDPVGDVALPTVDSLEFGQPGSSVSSSFHLENGNFVSQRSVTFTYPVRASARKTIAIPEFTVATNKGRLTVPAVSYDVSDATVATPPGAGSKASSTVSLESIAHSSFQGPSRSVWAGEVFPLTYTLNVTKSYFFQLASDPVWNAAPLNLEDWGKPVPAEVNRGGDLLIEFTYSTRASAKLPGEITLNRANQLVNLITGMRDFGILTQPTLQQFSITSAPATLTVKPLPLPAPADFSGAVGHFTFTSKVVPATVAVGEPVTWTVELTGTGNWPDIAGLPQRSVSRDFHAVQPQAKHTAKDKAIYDATLAEDVVLIPTKPGVYTLGPLNFSYFDPQAGEYRKVTTPAFSLSVTGAAAAAAPVEGATPPPAGLAAASPTPPAGIPRDPLPAAGSAPSPRSNLSFTLLLLAGALWVLPVWAAFALVRARRTDPRRPQREAHARLTTLLAQADPADFQGHLLVWQHNTAILFGLVHAAPSAHALAHPNVGGVSPPRIVKPRGEGTPPTSIAAAWSTLWAEADRALYGKKQPLPADWCDRALQALAAKPVRGFQPLQLFLPRNLFPRGSKAEKLKTETLKMGASATTAALLLLLLSSFILHPSSLSAADARSETQNSEPKTPNSSSAASAAYRSGDFPAAEKFWRDAVAANTTDWTAHHNLALALAQQNRWGETAGHALAAFVQHPQHPSNRWHLELALQNAGFTPDEVRPLLASDPEAELAGLASPAEWQWLAVAAAGLAALAPALWLWRAYGTGGRWFTPAAWTALVCGVLLGAAATFSLRLYGPLGDSRAVVVWHGGVLRSIPTEADTAQKTTPLSPGLVAVTDKSFLGWRRLAFSNGQTGWVRQEDLVNLW